MISQDFQFARHGSREPSAILLDLTSFFFARMCAEHSIEEAATASDAFCVLSIVHKFAEFSGNMPGMALTSRSTYDVCLKLSQAFPWRFDLARLMTTLRGHRDDVDSLAALEGGLLASGSLDNTIKIWRSTLCVAVD